MKETKMDNGITLIALIITIVVLLILAVVTINSVKGDGIVQYAHNAKTDYKTAEGEEETKIGTYLDVIDDNAPEATGGYKAYKIGDTVTIKGETFYVIEDSSKTNPNVKLLAKDCINTTTKKQSSSYKVVAFSSDNYWASTAKQYPYDIKGINEKDIALKYASEYGAAIGGTGRLMYYSEARTLESVNSDILYGKNGKSSTTYEFNYWLGTADGSRSVYAIIGESGIFGTYIYSNGGGRGIRPVVEILKSKISE